MADGASRDAKIAALLNTLAAREEQIDRLSHACTIMSCLLLNASRALRAVRVAEPGHRVLRDLIQQIDRGHDWTDQALDGELASVAWEDGTLTIEHFCGDTHQAAVVVDVDAPDHHGNPDDLDDLHDLDEEISTCH